MTIEALAEKSYPSIPIVVIDEVQKVPEILGNYRKKLGWHILQLHLIIKFLKIV